MAVNAGRRGRPTRQRSAAEQESIRRARARQEAAAKAAKSRLHIGEARPRDWVRKGHHYVTTLHFLDASDKEVVINEVTKSARKKTLAALKEQAERRVEELVRKYQWKFVRYTPEIRHYVPLPK